MRVPFMERAAAERSPSVSAAVARAKFTVAPPSGGGRFARPPQRSWKLRKSSTLSPAKTFEKKSSRKTAISRSSRRCLALAAAFSAISSSVSCSSGSGAATTAPFPAFGFSFAAAAAAAAAASAAAAAAASSSSFRGISKRAPSKLNEWIRTCTPREATTTSKRNALLGAVWSGRSATSRGAEPLCAARAAAMCPSGSSGICWITPLSAEVITSSILNSLM
mmetsp:Transcript_98494/g.199935  ORF Transcript_98494/g.199935 Transcript_98494/m.199935 type:complete len:221 (-) Transcript_98494:123-785(-)